MPRLLKVLFWPRSGRERQRLRANCVSPAERNPVWNQVVDAMQIARWVDTRQRLGRTTSAAGGLHRRQGLQGRAKLQLDPNSLLWTQESDAWWLSWRLLWK